ncbi:MAG TPA: diacylglycerol kinase family protein [Phycisphaerales bacterium]|nr:diacylglycerol kinase family protein [Phycisphaerales bacterium]
MNIVLLNNPNSGRATGGAVADGLAARLEEAGHDVTRLSASKGITPHALGAPLRKAGLLVVAGGDGTLHHALPAIVETGVAFYHFPMGTENLFTREFGMDRRPETLLRAIERGEVQRCDAGQVEAEDPPRSVGASEDPPRSVGVPGAGVLFSLMVSVGFDACVVERVAAARRGGVTRSAYVRAAVRELMRPRVPRVTVVADGRRVVDGAEGMLVVANSRQYAARLNPAAEASMSDGLLDVVFFPHRTAVGLARWLTASAGGFAASVPGVITAKAERIEVEVDRPTPRQIDGEAAGAVSRMSVGVRPGVLNVLVP